MNREQLSRGRACDVCGSTPAARYPGLREHLCERHTRRENWIVGAFVVGMYVVIPITALIAVIT